MVKKFGLDDFPLEDLINVIGYCEVESLFALRSTCKYIDNVIALSGSIKCILNVDAFRRKNYLAMIIGNKYVPLERPDFKIRKYESGILSWIKRIKELHFVRPAYDRVRKKDYTRYADIAEEFMGIVLKLKLDWPVTVHFSEPIPVGTEGGDRLIQIINTAHEKFSIVGNYMIKKELVTNNKLKLNHKCQMAKIRLEHLQRPMTDFFELEPGHSVKTLELDCYQHVNRDKRIDGLSFVPGLCDSSTLNVLRMKHNKLKFENPEGWSEFKLEKLRIECYDFYGKRIDVPGSQCLVKRLSCNVQFLKFFKTYPQLEELELLVSEEQMMRGEETRLDVMHIISTPKLKRLTIDGVCYKLLAHHLMSCFTSIEHLVVNFGPNEVTFDTFSPLLEKFVNLQAFTVRMCVDEETAESEPTQLIENLREKNDQFRSLEVFYSGLNELTRCIYQFPNWTPETIVHPPDGTYVAAIRI